MSEESTHEECALYQMALSIFNRHKARTLCNLEEANCPRAYRDSVKRDLDYLRKDILDLIGGQ